MGCISELTPGPQLYKAASEDLKYFSIYEKSLLSGSKMI